MLTTPTAFRAWLAALPASMIVGYPGEADQCPLATYLRAQGIPEPFVDLDAYWLDREESHALAPWASTFIRIVDDEEEQTALTAAMCLRRLRAACDATEG